MATKTIRIDLDAYDRLKAVQREGESFSQVIKRVVKKPLDVQQFLDRIGEHPISKEATAAIESQIKRRPCSSGRRR
jgi:predicted CopG family antitoxin